MRLDHPKLHVEVHGHSRSHRHVRSAVGDQRRRSYARYHPSYESADGYLQTTQGCSHNHCVFCTYFKDQPFRKATIEEIEADIREMPAYFGAPKRIFLQGADGFAADYDVLMRTAELLREHVPSVQSIGGYARIDNFYDKTEEQLLKKLESELGRTTEPCALALHPPRRPEDNPRQGARLSVRHR